MTATTSLRSGSVTRAPRVVVLRYFSVVGRAQSLRHVLADAGVAFEDVRIEVADWPRRREDPSFAGPYRGLPTLSWNDATIAETLVIATFLARTLGQYDGLSAVAIARLEAIASNAYLEVCRGVAELIWSDVANPGINLSLAAPRQFARVVQKLSYLDACAPEAGWFAGAEPGVADLFAAEAFEAVRFLLGSGRESALRAGAPRLALLADRVGARPSLASAWANRPARFTARPDEPDAIERLRTLDLSAAGV
jgi:glutathione S-transferase